MLKQKIIFFLCLFLSAGVFFSCGDVNNPNVDLYPLEEQNINICSFYFGKIFVNGSPNAMEITECMPGDTIGLFCLIYDGNGTYQDNLPNSVIAKITTSEGTGFITLRHYTEKGMGTGGEVIPPPLFYGARIAELKYSTRSGLLSFFKHEKVITAEMKGKNQTLKTTLTIRSK
jgi:hypothetical protein